jgi:alpha-tubulin suppressor-like RCC1 family protein
MKVGAKVFVLLVAASGCRSETEIVLVVDTNLSAVDIDQVTISVTGSRTQTVDVSLTAAGAPEFPLTLGLVPSGASDAVKVSVAGRRQGVTVVEQALDTTFVPNTEKMLRVLLLDACVGISCPTDPMPQTCSAGMCTSTFVPGSTLDPWTGTLPPPPPPSGPTPIGGQTIWANGWRSCAIEAGVLYCWGQNSDGQVGDGTQRNANTRRPVTGIGDLAAVGLGQFATCICNRAGKASCWGRNIEGELGIGAPSASSTTPVVVSGIDDCVQITGGAYHTCVLHAGGTVSCWGSNGSGQLGQSPEQVTTTCARSAGPAVPCLPSPALVPGLSNVAEIGAGERYGCARMKDMTVACWGDNSVGQLGDGTTTSRPAPAPVIGLAADVVELAVGRFFACARHASGAVSCWGGGMGGQLGNGTLGNVPYPVDVAGIGDAAHLGLGRDHGCVLRDSGTVWCWGGNAFGQLGNGTTTSALGPVQTTGLSGITSIAVGSVHTCARNPDGGAFCWGENIVNQLGDGTTTNRSLAVTVAGFM